MKKEIKQRSPEAKAAWIEGYRYAIKEMKSYVNSLDQVMCLIDEVEQQDDDERLS